MKNLKQVLIGKVNERSDFLREHELFHVQSIDKRIYNTEYYVCNNNDNEIELSVSVISSKLIVTNAAYLNNIDEIDIANGPVSIGSNNALHKQKLMIYSVASSIEDKITFTLNVTLTGGYLTRTFSFSLPLMKGETGEIIVQINFV